MASMTMKKLTAIRRATIAAGAPLPAATAAAPTLAALGVDPLSVAHALGIEVRAMHFRKARVAGFSIASPAMIFISDALNDVAKMATVAHELLHAAGIHREQFPDHSSEDIEYACDQGAMLLLAAQLLGSRRSSARRSKKGRDS